jgi:hypothetical protein
MAHWRRRPDAAGSRWPDKFERIDGALQVHAFSGRCKNMAFAWEDSDQ